MLRILQLEEIERKLIEVTALIESYKNHDPTFSDSVESWLEEVKSILERNRLATAGDIAALRGILLSVHNGTLPKDITITGRSTQRKRLAATAIDIINRAVNIVGTTIQADRSRISDAERTALHLISVSEACGLIKEDRDTGEGAEIAQALFRSMKLKEETVQGAFQLEALIGQSDAMIMIDRVLSFGLDQTKKKPNRTNC